MPIHDASYIMMMDRLERVDTRNQAGQVVSKWSVIETDIECVTESLSAQGMRGMGSGEEFNRFFKDVEFVRLRTYKRLSKSDRVTNIRIYDDYENTWVTLYKDGDGDPRDFHIQGINPITDLLGTILQYEYVIKGVDSGES